VESLQDKSKNSSHTIGASVSGGENGVSGGGVNANILSGSKKWVTEQTSLTGGSVDIYVEDKTTLKGAVIASTTGDLTLDTGSLEYRNIKDRDRWSNFGGGGNISGGAAPNSNSQSVSANYGFTDKRQTNFATIGEGEITVRDGKTELSKLNRDTTISQYSTLNAGLQGGFTLDTATVDLVAHPVDTVVNTAKAVEQGYEAGKKTTIETAEKIGNCYKSVNEGDGLTWENQDERVDRLYDKLVKKDYIEDAEGASSGQGYSNLERKRKIDEGYLSGLNPGDTEKITDPAKMNQNSKAFKEIIGSVYDELNNDISQMDKSKQYDEIIDKKNKVLEKAENDLNDLNPGTKEYKALENKIYQIKYQISEVEKSEDNRKKIIDYITSTPRDKFVNETASKLCYTEANWAIGTDRGKENRSFKIFYKEELIAGNIGSVDKSGKANAYYGTGGYEWAKKYGLNSSISGNYDTASNKYTSPVNENKVNELIKNSPVGTTLLIYKDTKNVGTGTHWVEAKIVTDGTNKVLIDYDHNRDSQGKLKEVDTSKVYKIIK
jgi:hypothetical protein